MSNASELNQNVAHLAKGRYRRNAGFLLATILTYGVVQPAMAQTIAEVRGTANILPAVTVSPSEKRAARSKQSRPKKRRLSLSRRPSCAARGHPAPTVGSASSPPETPLNSNAVAASASRLGLTAREVPATVEVISAETIRERGYRTVSDVAQGAVGVTSGDNPAEPSAFSMRGFTNSQINILYNGIKIGPQNMTSRIMDTANLEAVEFLKGPASLLSGEGASGGAINFVTKQPHTGPIRNEAYFVV